MYRILKFNLTRKFLLFFILTAIGPFLFFTSLYFNILNAKLQERIVGLLDTGILVIQELYQDELNRLELSTQQAATFSIHDKFEYYWQTGDIRPLQQRIQDYQISKGLDIYTIVDKQGNMIASSKQPEDLGPSSFRQMLDEALSGKTVTSVENFKRPQDGKITVTYVSASPVYVSPENRQVAGALLMGLDIDEHSTLKHLLQIIPTLQLRIFVKKPDGFVQALSTMPGSEQAPDAELLRQLQMLERENRSQSGIIQEKFGNEVYDSRIMVLKNFLGGPVAFVVVSTSVTDLIELQQKNGVYVGWGLVVCLILMSVAGYWFSRRIIDPIQTLSSVSGQVSSGNLQVRIPDKAGEDEIRKMSDSFNLMLDRLQDSNNLRSTFVATLTHDLRTPLVAQKRALDIFNEEFETYPDKRLVSLAQRLLKSNDTLLDMVNKLLEVYQYEDGKIALFVAPFNLNEVITACFEDFSELAASKQITLIKEVPDNIPPVYGDEQQIQRIFQNLLGNALQNISNGSWVKVQVKTLAEGLEIRVADNGPGIQPEILPQIFQRYFTGDRTRQKIGSGLGLYICKMIATLHGGTIMVDSQPGQGTCFTLKLPYRAEQKR